MSLGCALVVVTMAHWLDPAPVESSPDAEPSDFGRPPDPEAEPLPGAPPTVEESVGPRGHASLREGIGIDSASGRFGLSLGVLGQMRFVIDEQDGDVDPGFSLRLARTLLHGHMWGQRVTWQILTEFAGGVRLLDANATINIHPAFAILAGQYRPWFTRSFLINLPFQALPDRGPVLDAFRVDRDVGVTVFGRPFDGRMEYYAGVLNGEGVDLAAPRNPQPLVTARLVGAPLGSVALSQTTAANAEDDLPFRFAFAANAATNEISRVDTTIDPMTGMPVDTPLPDLRTIVVGGDVALQGWRVMAMGEGFWRRSQEAQGSRGHAWGAYGLMTGVLMRQRLELAMRVGALRLEGETAAHVPIEPGFNVFAFGDHAKVQLRYRCDLGTEGGRCLSQGGNLQAQLWF